MAAKSKAAIVAAARSAIGTARKGTLANTPAIEVAKPIVAAAVERSGLDATDFEDLILAESLQGGGDSARYIAVDLGFESIPGAAVNRQCASSMSRHILAGGMESLSTMPQFLRRTAFTTGKEAGDWERFAPMSNPIDCPDAPPFDMSITVAHNCAVEYGLTREDQDAWALRSHQRAVKAIDAGSFVDEIVPIQVRQQDGSFVTFAEDEHPRRETSMETLAGLKVLHPEIEGFSVTAGNSSGTNDAAAVIALATPDTQQPVLANILSWSQVGLSPKRTGSGPIYAIPKALDLAGLKTADVTLFEINEAFAAQAVACTRQLGLDEEKVNVYGSGISLGHPIAATGARMVTSAIHELRRRGGGIGVLSMCAGGGMGAAMVIEVA